MFPLLYCIQIVQYTLYVRIIVTKLAKIKMLTKDYKSTVCTTYTSNIEFFSCKGDIVNLYKTCYVSVFRF